MTRLLAKRREHLPFGTAGSSRERGVLIFSREDGSLRYKRRGGASLPSARREEKGSRPSCFSTKRKKIKAGDLASKKGKGPMVSPRRASSPGEEREPRLQTGRCACSDEKSRVSHRERNTLSER